MLTTASEMLTDVPELLCSSKMLIRGVTFFLKVELSLVLPRNDTHTPHLKTEFQEKANLKILLQILEYSSVSRQGHHIQSRAPISKHHSGPRDQSPTSTAAPGGTPNFKEEAANHSDQLKS